MPDLTPLEPPTFTQALNLEKAPITTASTEKYISTFPALSFDYAPGQPLSVNRSYGGHVFAQAIWAASQRIKDSGLRVHEANGYWTLGGYANRPFIYEVKTLSLTRSFALREVIARQPTTASDACPFSVSDAEKELGPVAFVLTCSFKLRERERGQGYWVGFEKERYGGVMHKEISSHPAHVYLKGPSGVGQIKLADFPGIDIRTPVLEGYNQKKKGTEHRRLHTYRAFESTKNHLTPNTGTDPNLIAAMHAYVSDRAGLSVLQHAFGAAELGISGSLNHKIIFHVDPEELGIDDKTWYVQEMSSSRGGEGRGVIDSRIWGPDGVLVATTIQDALFRQVKAKLV